MAYLKYLDDTLGVVSDIDSLEYLTVLATPKLLDNLVIVLVAIETEINTHYPTFILPLMYIISYSEHSVPSRVLARQNCV